MELVNALEGVVRVMLFARVTMKESFYLQHVQQARAKGVSFKKHTRKNIGFYVV